MTPDAATRAAVNEVNRLVRLAVDKLLRSKLKRLAKGESKDITGVFSIPGVEVTRAILTGTGDGPDGPEANLELAIRIIGPIQMIDVAIDIDGWDAP